MVTIMNFSGGRSSGRLLHEVINSKDYKNIIYIFANTSKETKETYQFIKDCVNYYKIDLKVVEYKQGSFNLTDIYNCYKNGEIFENLINHKKILPNIAWRFCTEVMKITPTKRYLKSLGIKKYINLLGIRADEPQRYSKIINRNSINIYNDMPLYYNGINKNDVNEFWEKMPFDLQHNSILGNCDLCFMKGKNKIINILRNDPSKAEWWIKQENKIGNTFIKDIKMETMLNLSMNPTFNFEDDYKEMNCNCNFND